MKSTTKFLGSTTGLLAAAAFSGMITGAAVASVPGKATVSKSLVTAKAGVKARNMDDQSGTDKHDCKGQNSCKGKGGCKSSDNGCKGQNSCKGKGGCKTNAAL